MRLTETDAETVATAAYFDDDQPDDVLHVEEASFPAGTTIPEILKEFAKRGRSARALQGRNKPPAEIVGAVFSIDN